MGRSRRQNTGWRQNGGAPTGVGARQVVSGVGLLDDVLVDLVPLALRGTPVGRTQTIMKHAHITPWVLIPRRAMDEAHIMRERERAYKCAVD